MTWRPLAWIAAAGLALGAAAPDAFA